ncbi:hypothetical protein LPJ66_004749 [Kickxella alabastrina]|uniref:Uncharacterized protein n=1 Tax=Kickxella alabastrina TaxID=61397 RepID=A0ACC1IIS9_9FUNG|nr:hypothetical protein LPJ66_004749 [Kickxella alabastrina]
MLPIQYFLVPIASLSQTATIHAASVSPTATAHPATFHPSLNFLQRRKLDPEDPANPVAATDPNEAAMKIRSRDLINTDRPNMRPDLHPHHQRGKPRRDDDEPGDNDSKSNAKQAAKKTPVNKKAAAKDEDDDDDVGDSDSKTKPKPKSIQKDKDSDKDNNDEKDGGKKARGKGDSGKDSKNNKKTHTGIDGNEVEDEDSEESEERKKKNRVNHIKAKQRTWRTGKPDYNYKKALDGWKDVGPQYYYKGKYENSAQSARLAGTVSGAALVPIILAVVSAALFLF